MNLKQLQDYRNWIDVSAYEVREAARRAGGWQIVFPTRIPTWASRVRNYFNEHPRKLTLLDVPAAADELKAPRQFIHDMQCAHMKSILGLSPYDFPNELDSLNCSPLPDRNAIGERGTARIAVEEALTEYAYRDDANRIWFQMDAGSGIFHHGSPLLKGPHSAIWDSKIMGQRFVPIFKLVSPDKTGGSRECILFNPMDVPAESSGIGRTTRRATVGKVNSTVNVENLIETDPTNQGSYNFSETSVVGFTQHKLRDMDPHPPYGIGAPEYYLNPDDRFLPLVMRKFPLKDKAGRTLADQN